MARRSATLIASIRPRTIAGFPAGRQSGLTSASFDLSSDAKHMLRSIRTAIRDDGIYRGSDAQAGSAAAVTPEVARRLLTTLAKKGFIRLQRVAEPD